MASFGSVDATFERDTPVLRLQHGKDRTVKWVLWPVLTWRVVAPVPRERALNLFQRAVLGLARAGVRRLTEVADRLLIAPDLAGLVVTELEGMGLVDHASVPTARGLEMLEDIEEDPADEVRVGHVVSDPFSGKLWPRFLTGDLPIADVELGAGGWPVLLSGTAGDPYRDPAFTILPRGHDAQNLSCPTAREVLRAVRRHRRQRDFDEVEDARDVPRLKRVSFIDERPEPYLLALRVRRHRSGDWMVDDPFGHGESSELRARLEARLDTHNGLRSWLAPLVGGEASEEPALGQLQAEAAWMVEERLTLAIRMHDGIRERLVAMQRALLEAELQDAPLDKWDDVLLKAQRAVERALRTVGAHRAGAKLPLYEQLAASDKDFNRSFLDAVARDLGFDAPLPETLSCVRRGKVQYAEERGSGSLRPLLVLALLAADQDEAHPLRRTAASQADLLHRLDDLARARDRAAHDGAATWPERVQGHVDTAFTTVAAVLLSTP